jgi:CTP:molybdopterin cytidylyltransferase MocA/ADP-ribose pyrophosphatase YjhB (NUDIX family)
MSEPRIAAVVLAAGTSSRLGRPKQLLPVDGYPLLSRTLDAVRASSLEPRILVLGGYAGEIRQKVRISDFVVVENPDFTHGQASSLRTGIQALPDAVDGAVVVLGDQPLIEPWLLDRLRSVFDPSKHSAVRPRYADGPGNPVLLARELFRDLLQLEGDVGARDILRDRATRIAEVDHTHRTAPRDVDTVEDYDAFLLDWSSSGAPDVPRYCQRCGAEVRFREIHSRLRPACPQCRFIYFFDPKITVAVLIDIDGKIVMHQRAGEPGMGKWTFPSGFVDRGEVVFDAAVREVEEEVGLQLDNLQLFNVYSQPGETVVLVVFTASASGQVPQAGDETTEVRLCSPGELPELAFPRDEQIVADWLATRDA